MSVGRMLGRCDYWENVLGRCDGKDGESAEE